ncbi:MAG: MlaD family protein [Bacteroidota bacterium]
MAEKKEHIPTKRATHPFLVGLFVLAGTFFIIGVILWLGASKFFDDYSTYVTYIDGSVEGLNVGSPVKYQGIPIGTISAVRLAPDGKLVEIEMEIDESMKINPRHRIQTELAGITGGKFLQLYYPDQPELALQHPALSFKPRYAVIPSTPSGVDAILDSFNDIVNNVKGVEAKQISDDTRRLLQSATRVAENPQIESSIANMNRTTELLARIIIKLDSARIIEQAAITGQNLNAASVQVQTMIRDLSQQLNGLDLDARTGKTFTRADSVLISAQGAVNKLSGNSDNVMFSLRETLEELRSTNRQIKRAVQKISDNPGRSFLSEPPPVEK